MIGWSRKDVCGEPVSRVLRLIDADTGKLIPSPVPRAIHAEAQLALSQKHGCGAFQGYLFSKPVSGQECTDRYITSSEHARGKCAD